MLLLLLPTGMLPVAAQSQQIDLDTDNDPSLIYDGIDVSSYQKDIDWSATARDKKIKFVYVKATEGATYTSRHYTYNMENARKHGIKVGSYHFFRTGSRVKDQFENFKRSVKKSDQDLIPLIDVETRQGWTAQQLRDSVKLFADLVEDYYGCRPMIYTSSSFFNNLLGTAFADYPLFIARYAKWTLWQFSEKGRISGIDHPVDLCRFNKGCTVRDILIKDNKLKGGKRKASDEVDKKERPGKVDTPEPALSKKQEQEQKAKQEKERKAKERAKKLAENDAKAKAEKEKKAKEKAAKEKAAKEKAAKEKAEKEKKAKEKAEKEKKTKEKAAKEKAEKEKAAKEKAAKEKAEKEKAAQAQSSASAPKTLVKSKSQQRQEQIKQQKEKLATSQRNDSIRKAKQKGKKTNKSSADND